MVVWWCLCLALLASQGVGELTEKERAKIIAKYSTTNQDSILIDPSKVSADKEWDTFMLVARTTYSKVLPCLKSAWMMGGKDTSHYIFPHDAQEHYDELKKATEKFRNAPVHEYSNYEGPWIENLFIQKFMDKPLSYFRGMIPLFVQWIDTQILRGPHFNNIHEELNHLLRPGVIYLAVSQGDVGLGMIGAAHPNILVLSAGGYGHVPLPLVKSEVPHSPHVHHAGVLNLTVVEDGKKVVAQEYRQDIGFFGTMNQQNSGRQEILEKIANAANKLNMTHKYDLTSNWQKEMGASKFNLCPRGYGRSSFRFAESIQIGRLPVFLWDDVPWIPYHGTNLSVEHFGFQRGLKPIKGADREISLESLVDEMHSMTEQQYKHKMVRLHDARYHYTYPGVLAQIEKFISNPFDHHHGGQLRCTRHPKTERCCDTK